MSQDKLCTRCKFFHPTGSDEFGECRFHAPRPLHPRPQHPDDEFSWPVVGYEDWCGQWAWNGKGELP